MILEVGHLTQSYRAGQTVLDDVSLSVKKGEVLGVAGESGCGKTTLLKVILGLVKPKSGLVEFKGKRMGMVFQNPASSLDPLMSVEQILGEAFVLKREVKKNEFKPRAVELLKAVELPENYLLKKPHQMSGGECQRVAIARALLFEPDLLLCDEAVSSLDALVQVSILNLFLKLFEERRISCVFVSHDLRVIRHMSDRVVLMQNGRVLEAGPTEHVFRDPKHAYTQSLLVASGLR